MAYTTTTDSKGSTVVGTSSADTLDSALTGKIQINSYEGNDSVTLKGATTSGTVGMGGGKDTVTFSTAGQTKLNVTLGDAADTFSSTVADTSVTIGGQGGADKFTVNSATATKNRYAGGKGTDLFTITDSGDSNTIVGGSENDIFNIADSGQKLFVNGQVGADTIAITQINGGSGADAIATIRGGSENDTISLSGDNNKVVFYGDNGADKITDGAGDNTLNGGGGKDTLIGGDGLDTYIGGEGINRFKIVTDEAGLVTDTGDAEVVIADFKAGSTLKVSTLEKVTGFGAGNLIDTNNTASANATTVQKDGGALTTGISYFAFGTYKIDGTFTVAATGDDAVVFVGAEAGATGTDAGHLKSDSWFVIDGGAANLTAASFV